MNWDRIESNWQHFRFDVQHRWKKLTDHELDTINGNRALLSIAIQTVYQMSEASVDLQINEWQRGLRTLNYTTGARITTRYADGR